MSERKGHPYWVTVIGILIVAVFLSVAICIPDFSPPSTSKLVSRVEKDFGVLEREIDRYVSAHGELPPMVPRIPAPHNDTYEFRASEDAQLMTYSQMPELDERSDPFYDIPGMPYAWSVDSDQWFAYSPGPNYRYDIRPGEWSAQISDPKSFLTLKTYDPTNGTVSAGDIWSAGRSKP